MEREVRGRRRGRRGVEMRKGIIVGGMVLSLLLGCNNGGEDSQKVFLKSVVSLGNNFLDVFTSFGDMVGGVLGFDKTTPKSKVGDYFKQVKETVEGAKSKLEKIVADMKIEGNPNAVSAEAAVKTLVSEKLDKIIEGAKTASEAIGTDSNLIANVAAQNNGGSVNDGSVDSLLNGIKGIVEVVLGGDKGNADAGTDKKATDGTASRSGGTDAGILFASNNAGSNVAANKSATDAVKAVGAVTGADILQAVVKKVDAVTLAKNSATNGNAGDGKKDAVIAGAVALRAMAKNGRFANSSDTDISSTIKDAAISAVTKVLETLTIAIRKTIDEGLKKVKEAIKINANDTAVTTEVKSQ